MSVNLYEDEFLKFSMGKDYLTLNEVLKLSVLDELGEHKINLVHIRNHLNI